MLAAICEEKVKDRRIIEDVLQEKMEKRQEVLEIKRFNSSEDLLKQYELGGVRYDLILMNPCTKNGGGIEPMRQIREYDSKVGVIFVAAGPEYAVEGYEVRAYGYLLKPIERKKLEMALNRFLKDRYPRTRQSLLMISGPSGRRIAYDDILYIESRRMNLRVVCKQGVEYSIRKKLDEVQEELPKSRFLRCNQSFIVNMDFVKEATTDFLMENGDYVPIKVREKKKIRDQYFNYVRKQE